MKAKKENEILKLSENSDKIIVNALKKSEAFFKGVTENTSDIILIVDKMGTFKYISPSVENILGYPPDEFIGKKIFKYIHRKDIPRAIVDFGKAILTKQVTVPNSFRVLHKDGSERVLEGIGKNQFKNPAIAGFIMNIHDITKHKKSEKRIRFLSSVVEQSADGMAIADLDGKLLFLNESWVSMHGYETTEELLNQNLSIFHNENQLVNEVEPFNRKVIENGYYTGEVNHIRKDGTIFPTLMTSSLLRDENGNTIAISGVATDITERKVADNELKDSEIRYFNLFENSSEFLFTLDLKGNFTDVNKAAEIITGYTKSELLTKNFKDYTPEKYHKKLFHTFFNIYKTGTPLHDYPIEAVIKDKSVKYFETTLSLLKKGKDIIGYQGSSKDITERKRAEKLLKESEKLFKDITYSMADWVWEVDKDGRYTYTSEKVEEILGYRPDELIGKTPFDFMPEDEAKRVGKLFKEIISVNNPIKDLENWNLSRDGELVCLLTNAIPLLDSSDELVGYRGVDKDITEKRKTEEALKESEEKYRNLIVTTSEGFWLFDSDQKTVDVNQSLCDMLGYSRSEMIDKTPFDFVNDENLKVLKEQASRITTTLHRIYEIILKKKNGINLPTIFNATSLIDKKGKPCGSFVLVTDITERKLAETELVKAKAKAEESDRLKSAFLSNMSHEIRTPMNGILGFADLLKEPGLTGEEHQNYLAVIEKSGTRMLSIINDIINISKIEAGLMELNMQESNINEQIEYIYTFFKPEIEGKGTQFSFRNSLPSKEAIIKTDREKVYAILTNLVKNAIKYTEKGSIEFGYTKKGNFLEFYVKDTGLGIPKDRQKAIFERFIQADVADKYAFQGSGLGLSISKAYIEMLGGKIWVESEEGKGSTFYFTLPYESKTIKENSTKNEILPPVEASPIKKLKILIVEDDETSEELLSIVVRKLGNEIINVKTGKEAVEACLDNPDIDLVLMDILMPEMDGHEATRQIRKFNKDVIIIAQTAYALEGDKEKAIAAGCDDYLPKPINAGTLNNLIANYF